MDEHGKYTYGTHMLLKLDASVTFKVEAAFYVKQQ